jgi:hypothetical protein
LNALPLLAAAPVVRTIAGGRLTIDVGDDTSLQVRDSVVPDSWAFQPIACGPGQTADAGTLVSIGGATYGPDFSAHPCGTSAPGSFTPWTPVSISAVTGTGTVGDPFTVIVVVDAGATGLRLSETITHVAGTGHLMPTLAISNSGPTPLTFATYLGTSMHLGFYAIRPILDHGAPGGQGADKVGAPSPACAPRDYFADLPAADRYNGGDAAAMWASIAAGDLSNTLAGPGCSDGGIATEWTARALDPGASLSLGPGGGIAFVPALPGQTAPVPVSRSALAVIVVALGLLGSLGARGESWI